MHQHVAIIYRDLCVQQLSKEEWPAIFSRPGGTYTAERDRLQSQNLVLGVFSHQRLDVFRLGDHDDSARRHNEAALFVLFWIEADPDAFGD